MLSEARAAWAKRHVKAQSVAAVSLYEKAIAANVSYAALWEGARAASYLGQHGWAKVSRSQRRALYEKGLDWAERATKVNPRGAEGHYYTAVLSGLNAQEHSFLHQMNSARGIRRAAERALKLDPSVECGGPPRLLGIFFRRLPSAFGGDNNKARAYLVQSLRHCPNDAELHYTLAECLHALDRDDEARQQAQWVLKHPPQNPHDRRSYAQTKRNAEELLSDID